MSQPLLQKAMKPKTTKAQRAAVVLACVVPVVIAAVALPALMSSDDEPAPAAAPTPVQAGTAPAPVQAPTTPPASTEPAPAEAAKIATSEDGDLGVDLILDDDGYAFGEPVKGVVRLTNHMLKDVHVPAAGEPNAGLEVVVLDAEGMEVRRIIERGAEPLPRRTLRLASGAQVELPVTLLARGEEPLPAGTLSAHVEFDADPVWRRLGLPVWTAPNGTVRSYPIFFRVAEKVTSD